MAKKSIRATKSSPVVEEPSSKRGGMKFWKKRKKKITFHDGKDDSGGNDDNNDGSNKENTNPLNVGNNVVDNAIDSVEYQNADGGSPASTSSKKSHYSQLEVTKPGVIGGVNQHTIDDNNVTHNVDGTTSVSQSDANPSIPPPPPKSSPPSPWEKTAHSRNKMCIAKLQALARLHGGTGGVQMKTQPNTDKDKAIGADAADGDSPNTPSKILGNPSSSPSPSSPVSTKSDRQTPTKSIQDKILGSSTVFGVQKETKEALKGFMPKPESPTSVINLSSLKNGIQELANTSLTSIFNCATNLKQVQCENLQDGVYELKEDLFYTYKKTNRHMWSASRARERGHEHDHDEYDDYYDEESTCIQTDDDCTGFGESTLTPYDDTTCAPTITTKDTRATRDTKDTSIFDGSTSAEGSAISASPYRNESNTLNKENEFTINSDNLQPKQMENLGVPMSDRIQSGDIPMKENYHNVHGKHLANPTTSNIPWDERSESSKSSDMVVGNRGVRLGEGGLVSLHDIDKSVRMNSYHDDYELQNPLQYRASTSLRKDEGEI